MLHDWFIHSVRRFPDEPALIVDGQRLTYAELDAVSRGIKYRLLAEGAVRPRVGLLASRSVAAYAGYLAVLRVGGVVVPLDSSYPSERLALVARSAALDFVVADRSQDAAFVGGLTCRVLRVGSGSVSDLLGSTVRDDARSC